MASKTYKSNTFRKKQNPKKAPAAKSRSKFSWAFVRDKRIGLSFGIILMMVSIFLFFAFLGYVFSGESDQSVVLNDSGEGLRTTASEAQNWLGYMGATVSHLFIFRWFGLAAFLLPPLLFFIVFRIAFKKSLVSLWRYSAFTLFFVIWLGLLLGYLVHISDDFNLLGFLSGRFGYELAVLASDF